MPKPYPHLLPDDVAVWERYLKEYGEIYSQILYDLRVGTGRNPGPQDLPQLQDMAVDLTQRRIDAVAVTDDAIHLIEITHTIGLKALGQYIAYPCLYIATFHPPQPIIPIIVGAQFQTDIKSCCDALKVNYVIV